MEKQKQNRKKKEAFDHSDSDFVEIPITTQFFLFPLERKTPYASDSDSASDYVTSWNQP